MGSTYKAPEKLAKVGKKETQEKMAKLLAGGSVTKELKKNTV